MRQIKKPNMAEAVREKVEGTSGKEALMLLDSEEIIREPLGSNRETIGEQLGNDKGTELGNNKGAIREPLGNDKGTARDLDHLTGNESKVLRHLHHRCCNRGQRTIRVTLSEITEALNISSRDVSKTTLARLTKKEFIIRKGGKRGNGGFAIFEIPERVCQALVLNKGAIREPLGNDKGTSGPSSSFESFAGVPEP